MTLFKNILLWDVFYSGRWHSCFIILNYINYYREVGVIIYIAEALVIPSTGQNQHDPILAPCQVKVIRLN